MVPVSGELPLEASRAQEGSNAREHCGGLPLHHDFNCPVADAEADLLREVRLTCLPVIHDQRAGILAGLSLTTSLRAGRLPVLASAR